MINIEFLLFISFKLEESRKDQGTKAHGISLGQE